MQTGKEQLLYAHPGSACMCVCVCERDSESVCVHVHVCKYIVGICECIGKFEHVCINVDLWMCVSAYVNVCIYDCVYRDHMHECVFVTMCLYKLWLNHVPQKFGRNPNPQFLRMKPYIQGDLHRKVAKVK